MKTPYGVKKERQKLRNMIFQTMNMQPVSGQVNIEVPDNNKRIEDIPPQMINRQQEYSGVSPEPIHEGMGDSNVNLFDDNLIMNKLEKRATKKEKNIKVGGGKKKDKIGMGMLRYYFA